MIFETEVKEIIQRTYDVKSFRFPRPSSLDYEAGQFLFVTIKWKKERLKKHFTISSSPTEKGHIEFTKKLTGSRFSDTLNRMEVGDWAKIEAPYGNFTFKGQYGKIGLLSGGIGITPLRSICKFCTDKGLDTDIVLLYGNVSESDIVFRNELKEMQNQNEKLKVIFTLEKAEENWSGYTGFINIDMIEKEIPDYSERIFYISGPIIMVKAMEKILLNLKVPESQIKKDFFPGY